MDRFVSHFTNRLDVKGRISVPASFRGVLARDGFEGVYVYPSLDAPALDAGGNALLSEIDALLSGLALYSDERDSFATALHGTSEVLKIDGEGRIILTEHLKAHANIGEAVTFVGLGSKFRIWEPERFRAHLADAQERVRELKGRLGKQAGMPGDRA